jgi:2-hydroxy-3-oxopropionate reductase
VLGIGFMGFPIARRLCEAGFTVHAWNRSPAKAERLRPLAPGCTPGPVTRCARPIW